MANKLGKRAYTIKKCLKYKQEHKTEKLGIKILMKKYSNKKWELSGNFDRKHSYQNCLKI
jgi:hypothetical protein